MIQPRKYRILFFLLWACIFAPISLLAQAPVYKVVNGIKCIVHTVEKGNTLYNISKKYDVTTEEITKFNPEAANGLSLDQVLLIPQGPAVIARPPKPKGGKTHLVKPKETLYGIKRQYGVDINDLMKANPDLKDGLKEGMTLTIPTGTATEAPSNPKPRPAAAESQVVTTPTPKPTPAQPVVVQPVVPKVETPPTPSVEPKVASIAHTVVKEETLYSLGKKYNVSIDSIKWANNGLPQGLRLGDIILIPQHGEMAQNPVSSFKEDSVIQADNGVIYEEDSGNFKGIYNVAVMLPLFLDMNDSIRIKRKEFEEMEVYGPSLKPLEFYRGVKLAVDSMQKKGLSVRLHVYDTNNDTNLVNALLQRREMQYMDLFIGPLYTRNFRLVSRYCKANQVPQVCPVKKSNKILLGNPYVSKVPASAAVQVSKIASHVLKNYKEENVLLINSTHLSDAPLVETFKNRSQMIIRKKDSNDTDTIQVVKVYSPDVNFLRRQLDKEKVNVLVVPTVNLAYASKLLTRLYKLVNEEYEIKVFGIDTWLNFEQKIDVNYLHACQVHLTHSFYADLNEPETRALYRAYRQRYFTDPGEEGIKGYSITTYYLNALMTYGKNFSKYLNEIEDQGVGNGYKFFRTGPESGFENNSVSILKYEDYKKIKVE